MLKVWNVSLVLATGTLAVMGTFLVRSGVLNSIHAFGGAPWGCRSCPDRAPDRRLDLPRGLAAGPAALGGQAGLAAVPGGDLPGQQPRAGGALLRDLLGHLLPADLRGALRPRSLRRAALVRPLHRPAGAGPGAAERHRPGHRLAPGDARQRAAQLPRAACRRARDARRAAARRARRTSPSRPPMFCCAAFVLRQRRAGVRPRHPRPPGDRRRARPARAAGARAAQPQALRRLHRAPRHGRAVRRRGGLLVLPARRRAGTLAGPVHPRRRLHRPLREADRHGHPQQRRRPHRRAPEPGGAPAGAEGRKARGHARTRARATTPPANPARGPSAA